MPVPAAQPQVPTVVYSVLAAGLWDGVTPDDVAISAQAAVLGAAGGGIILCPPATAAQTGPISLPAGVRLRGVPGVTTFKPRGSGYNALVPVTGYSYGACYLTQPAYKSTNYLMVTTPSGLVAGQYMFINLPVMLKSNPTNICLITRIIGVNASPAGFNVADVLPENIALTDPYQIQVWQLTENVGIEGVVVDMADMVGPATAHGIYAYGQRNLQIHNVEVRNAVLGSGVASVVGYRTDFDKVTTFNCGTGGYNDIQLSFQTGARVRNLHSESASGFGPGLNYVTDCFVRGVLSLSPHNRGFKINAGRGCVVDDVVSNFPGSTAIAITLGTQECKFSNLSARRAVSFPGNSEGLWFSDDYNSNNTITGYNFKDNALDIYVGVTDTGNQFSCGNSGADLATCVNNAGLATFIGHNGYLRCGGNPMAVINA